MLQVKDHITDPQTLNFLTRYLENAGTCISIEDFCDSIQSEFFVGLISPVLNENQNIDEEALMSDIFQEVKLKISIDE